MWPGKRDGNEANVQKVRSMCKEESGVRPAVKEAWSGQEGGESGQVRMEGSVPRSAGKEGRLARQE